MDVVGERLDASKAEALVPDPFANFLIARSDVADSLEVRVREAAPLVGDEQHARVVVGDQ
ncbi:hypothetical protein D3C87_1823610 [compost metagenome]